MLNPCINCKDNSSECIKCFEKEVLGHHAEIAELKNYISKLENDNVGLKDDREDFNIQLDKAKDTIARRNKQIADLSSKLKKATHCKMCGKPFETLTEVCYPCQVK